MDSKPVVADESASGDPQSMEEAHLNMAILRLKLLYSKVCTFSSGSRMKLVSVTVADPGHLFRCGICEKPFLGCLSPWSRSIHPVRYLFLEPNEKFGARLLTRQTIPAADVMFNAFMRAVEDAQADVTEVTELMKDEESKQVFARADKSREQNPFGIKPWKHTGDSEWLKTEDKD